MERTLKFFAAYWLIGCLFAGNVIGWAGERCADVRKSSMGETLAFVAIWPAALPLIFYDWPPATCTADGRATAARPPSGI